MYIFLFPTDADACCATQRGRSRTVGPVLLSPYVLVDAQTRARPSYPWCMYRLLAARYLEKKTR